MTGRLCLLVYVQEGQVIECSQVSDVREGVSPKVRLLVQSFCSCKELCCFCYLSSTIEER